MKEREKKDAETKNTQQIENASNNGIDFIF
ncbi:MAG: hypothetical protein ACI8RD_001530 [Bacillariaceae sp.]|jgi:hypothetical protein